MIEILAGLLPQAQQAFSFIANSAASGVIGNYTHEFAKRLFPHQKENITKWLNSWNPTEEDIIILKSDKNIGRLFSLISYHVSNEIYDKKLELWPTITDSIVRNKKLPFDKKEYFTTLFIQLNSYSLQYLGKLYNSSIDYSEVFNMDGTAPSLSDPNISEYLGQLQLSTTGLNYLSNGAKQEFKISELGKEFIDFISNESLEKRTSN